MFLFSDDNMSERIDITVTPPYKESMLLAHHFNIEIHIESKNLGQQQAYRTSTNRLPAVVSIEIPGKYTERLSKAERKNDSDSNDHIRITATVTHSITGVKVSNTNNAVILKNQNFEKMRCIYIESKE
jgi:hypothetical protein